MPTENTVLMRSARESLTGKWGLAIGTFAIYMVIMGSFGAFQKAGLLSLLVAGPLELGAVIFSLSLSRNEETRVEQLFSGFKYFGNALVTYLIMIVLIFLWLLLLIVPGIIAALSYSMSFYILADNPSLKGMDVLNQSKEMMDGHKLRLFYLMLRFFLLGLLCILTLGIGFLWLVPYFNITMAKFYDDLREGNIHAVTQYTESDMV
jgi:uncharacterized membrane protein